MSERARPVRIRERKPLTENWFKLERVSFDLRRADGSQQTLAREVYHNGPGAAVLPIDRARGMVLLVRQLRIAAYVNGDDPFLIELCAGMVDTGDEPGETVRKEAHQELGYRLRNTAKVFDLYMSPGASAERLHLFVAEYDPGDHVGRGGGVRSEGEEIEVLELPLGKAWEMITTRQIVDAKTVLLLQHVRLGGV
jgi:nudix-type nucleoside diphosphatase (YffH/AdpP family)